MSLLQGRVGLADAENWERLQTRPKQGCRKELSQIWTFNVFPSHMSGISKIRSIKSVMLI